MAFYHQAKWAEFRIKIYGLFVHGAYYAYALIARHVFGVFVKFGFELALAYIVDLAGKGFAQDGHAAVFRTKVRMIIRTVK